MMFAWYLLKTTFSSASWSVSGTADSNLPTRSKSCWLGGNENFLSWIGWWEEMLPHTWLQMIIYMIELISPTKRWDCLMTCYCLIFHCCFSSAYLGKLAKELLGNNAFWVNESFKNLQLLISNLQMNWQDNFLGADSMFRPLDTFTHFLAITKILHEIKENFVPFVLFIPSQALGKFHSIGFLMVKRKSGETQP